MIESDLRLHSTSTDSVQHTEHTHTITICGVFGHIKGYLEVNHGSQVVNFRGTHFGNNVNEIGSITQVSIVQK
jgi:hypothetical protein